MEILFNIVLLMHFVGFAALFGGAFVQVKGPQRVVNPAMWHGALTMLGTGIALTAIWEMGSFRATEPNHIKIGIKLLLMLAVFVLVLINRKKERVPDGIFFAIAGLTLVNAVIAVFV